jgi:taurine dioxygenase
MNATVSKSTRPSPWTVNRVGGSLGAEVLGLDLMSFDPADLPAIEDLVIKHHVVVFRGQTAFNEQGLLNFGRMFGELREFAGAHSEYAGVKENTKAGGVIMNLSYTPEMARITERWHSEATSAERPPSYTILRALKLPEAGGDTAFANQHIAFERLSDTFKNVLRGLKAIHSYDYGPKGVRSIVHPVVRKHPATGRETLFVSETFVKQFEGMTVEESQPILRFLFDFSVKLEFCYRHRWLQDDVVMWDNRSVLHRAIHDFGNEPGARVMNNVQTKCEAVL